DLVQLGDALRAKNDRHSSYHSVTNRHSTGLQWWWCDVFDRAIFKCLLSRRPSCVDLKGETVGQLPIIGVGRIVTEVPGPFLNLVVCQLPTRKSPVIVYRSTGSKELFTDGYISRLAK